MEAMHQPAEIESHSSPRFGTRRTRIAVAAVTAVLAAVGIVLVFALGGESTTSSESVAATLRVPGHPGWITAGEDAMWLSMNCDVGSPCETRGFTRIDLATGTVEMTVALEGEPSFTAHVGDSLIASHFPDGFDNPGEVLRLDWKTGEILARAPVPYGPGQLVQGDGALWLATFQRDVAATIQQIDPLTLQPIGEPFPVSNQQSVGLAYGDGMLWATASVDGELVRIDAETGETTRGTAGGFPAGVVLAGGSVWVANRESGTVSRVDPTTMQEIGDPIVTGGLSTWIVAAAGSVWVASQEDGTVTRIDATTGEQVGSPIRVADPSEVEQAAAHAMSVVGDSIWVTSMTEDTVSRIDPARG